MINRSGHPVCAECDRPLGKCDCPADGRLVRQPHGGAIRRGGGGKAGNIGGTPQWLRQKLREMGSHPKSLSFVEECLSGVHGAHAALTAWGYCLRYGLGDKREVGVQVSGWMSRIDINQLSDDALRAIAHDPVTGLANLLASGRPIPVLPESDVVDAEIEEIPE